MKLLFVVGTATGYWMETDRSGFESLSGKDFSPLQVVLNGFEAHPVSCPVSTGGSFSRAKLPE
jgi:hypothetical protein